MIFSQACCAVETSWSRPKPAATVERVPSACEIWPIWPWFQFARPRGARHALVGYPASFYEDGVDAAATGTGMLYVPECCAVAELSAVSDLRGAWVVAHRWPVSSLGGSEASP